MVCGIVFFFAFVQPLSAQTIQTTKTANTTSSTDDKDVSNVTSLAGQLAMSSPDYEVTAGDIYFLSFAAGSAPVKYSIPVDSTYRIRVANLAVVDVAGKTYPELKQLVESIVVKNYPMSGVQFVLATPAVFKVTLKGEVSSVQERNAGALSRLSTVVAGSFTAYSSTRDIEITSLSGKKKSCDLFKADRLGDLSQNPYVRPGDVITIKRTSRRVTVNGAVERPGAYQLLEGENYAALVTSYGGGFSEFANKDRVEITRLETGTTETKRLYLTAEQFTSDFALCDDDTVSVSTIYDLLPVMYYEGAVRAGAGTAGPVEGSQTVASTKEDSMMSSARIPVRFSPGTDYAFFVRTNRAMFTTSADLSNAYIIRESNTIPLNISRIMYDSSYASVETVQAGDTLMVPFKQYFVTVSGAVQTPGRYPYIPDRGWDYYIGLAGGFNKLENSSDSVIITDMNGKRHDKSEPVTPETNIMAKSNSFTYYFNRYSGVVTTTLTAITTAITVMLYMK